MPYFRRRTPYESTPYESTKVRKYFVRKYFRTKVGPTFESIYYTKVRKYEGTKVRKYFRTSESTFESTFVSYNESESFRTPWYLCCGGDFDQLSEHL